MARRRWHVSGPVGFEIIHPGTGKLTRQAVANFTSLLPSAMIGT
jgi:hypothetical protein